MRLVALPIAGSGGRPVHLNPEQVVCVVDLGDARTQVVTTGLSGDSSISLVIELAPAEVASRLQAAVAAEGRPRRAAAYPEAVCAR